MSKLKRNRGLITKELMLISITNLQIKWISSSRQSMVWILDGKQIPVNYKNIIQAMDLTVILMTMICYFRLVMMSKLIRMRKQKTRRKKVRSQKKSLKFLEKVLNSRKL